MVATAGGVVADCCTAMCGKRIAPKPHQRQDASFAWLESWELREGRKVGMEGLQVRRRIGEGNSSTVYEVAIEGRRFALKIMPKAGMSPKKLKRALTEHAVLCSVGHPLIVNLYRCFETVGTVGFLMEHCDGGDLYQLINRQPGSCFAEGRARMLTAQVVSALEYLHLNGFVYRDLKPENILIDARGNAKLSDFDLSAFASSSVITHRSLSTGDLTKAAQAQQLPLQRGGSLAGVGPRGGSGGSVGLRRSGSAVSVCVAPPAMRTDSFVGTVEYLAPEVVVGKGYTAMIDFWSLGVLLFELLYGRTPFRGDLDLADPEAKEPPQKVIMDRIVRSEVAFPDKSPRGDVGDDAKDLIAGLLAKQPGSRLGGAQGWADVKGHAFFEGINWSLVAWRT